MTGLLDFRVNSGSCRPIAPCWAHPWTCQPSSLRRRCSDTGNHHRRSQPQCVTVGSLAEALHHVQSPWRPQAQHTARCRASAQQSDTSQPYSIPVTLISGTSSTAKHQLISSLLSNTPSGSISVHTATPSSLQALLSHIQHLLPASHSVEASGCVLLNNGSMLGAADELDAAVSELSKGRVQHLVLEDGPVDSPLMTSAAFSDLYPGLDDVAHVDTLITVVDAPRFIPDVLSSLSVCDLDKAQGAAGAQQGEGGEVDEDEQEDDRMVSDVLVEQVEYAHHLVLSGLSSMSAADKAQLLDVLVHLNRLAKVHDMDSLSPGSSANQLLSSGRFDLYQIQQQGPGWAVELNRLEAGSSSQPPVSSKSSFSRLQVNTSQAGADTGVESWLYVAHRPFHPARLLRQALAGQWPGVVRSKGYCWLATRHDYMGLWQSAGGSWQCEPNGKWLACVPGSSVASSQGGGGLWHPVWGDRCQQLVWTGIHMQVPELRAMLDECLLTDEEMAQGVAAWSTFEDPLPDWLFEEHDSDEEEDGDVVDGEDVE